MGIGSFLSGLFSPNSVTGLVVSTFRDFENETLKITLQRDDGPITLEVGDELSVEIERLLIARKQRGQTTTMTLVYDPDTYKIVSYSIVS